MFYALFESRNESSRNTDPLVIWIRGTPGCSASKQMISETGPYRYIQDPKTGAPTLTMNEHSFNNFSNALYLDLQIDTGYSFKRGENQDARNMNIDQVINDFLNFMKMFLTQHTSYRGREIYLMAQDFAAGSYVPALTAAV